LFTCFFGGIPLPYLFDNRFVFNLHLLRSAGLEQAIAVILTVMAGTKLVLSLESIRRQLLGIVILTSLITFHRCMPDLIVVVLALAAGLPQPSEKNNEGRGIGMLTSFAMRHTKTLTWMSILGFAIVLAYQAISPPGFVKTTVIRIILIISAFGLVLHRGLSPTRHRKMIVIVFALMYFLFPAIIIYGRVSGRDRDYISAERKSWDELVAWVRGSDLHGTFLIPLGDEADLFQLRARRSVWVDRQQGAAVMWSPSFHDQWMQRVAEVSTLHSPEDFVAYAKKNGIRYVVIKSDAAECPTSCRLLKSTKHYILCMIDDR